MPRYCSIIGYLKPTSLLVMLAFAMLSAPTSGASIDNSHRVENLAYGKSLFDFFQRNELEAITSLMVAEQKPQTTKQRDESDLLLADLFYSYGLYGESNRLFSRLLNDATDKALLNRVWFNLARLNHEQGHYDQALDLLSRIDDTLPDALQNEKLYLLTSLYLGESKFNDANRAFQKIDQASIWYQYARYNLGVSLLENNQPDEGRFFLEALAEQENVSEERQALRDQINLSLGLSHLRNAQPELAITSFERIRLEGPLSHTALLATGWAWNRQAQFGKALVPWLELAKKNSIDPATQEALLAIPTALEENQKPKLAVQYYELAAKQFDKQLKALDQSITTIEAGELIGLLNKDALIYDGSKFAATSLQSTSAPYLHLLIASAEFQRAIKRYQELIDIRATLNHWNFNLPTLTLMLGERRRNFQQKLPLLEQSSNFDNLLALQESRNILASKLSEVETTGDFFSLATIEEKDQLDRLNKVSGSFNNIGDRIDTEDEQGMHRLFTGLLDWQISTSYAPRLWAAQKQLKALDQALDIASSRAGSLRQVSSRSLQTFDDFEFRIQSQEGKIGGLVQRVTNLIERQEKRINKLAISEIDRQKRHLIQLRLNARYALARLYDAMVSE